MQNTSRSRRAVLAGIASAGAMPLVAAIPTIAPAEASQAIDPIFVAIEAYRRADTACVAVEGDIPDDVGDRWHNAYHLVLRTRPTTPGGLAALTTWARQKVGWLHDQASMMNGADLLTLSTTIDDAVRGMSGLEPWSPPPAVAPVPVDPHPDAELFEAVERYLSALSEYANSALAFDDLEFIEPRPRGYVSKKRAYHRTMDHFGRMEDELVSVRAKTLDGLLAKARALEADRDVSDDLKESTLNDLFGMASEIGKAVAS
jgi:hypothetical protein